MNVFNLSPEKYKSPELAPELAERMSEVQQSVRRIEWVIQNAYPEEFLQQQTASEMYQGQQLANSAAEAPQIQGVGHSELTPDNVTNIRSAIDRYASPTNFLQEGIRNDTEKAA